MSQSEVSAAAAALVAAFGSHDREGYFACFAPSATFLFYNFERPLTSRADYEAVWREWEAGDFRVLGCVSTDGAVTMLRDDLAVFTHAVRTTLKDGESSIVLGERESIVFQRVDGRWFGVHEHLSPDPTFI